MEHLGTFIVNHWQLVLALLVILLLILINEILTQKKGAHVISPAAAVNKINHDNATIFDIRSPEEFAKGHILDSIPTDPSAFEQKKMEKYKKKSIILVCAKGILSIKLASKLIAGGYENVYVIQGGIDAWHRADLPLVKKSRNEE